MFQFGNWQTQRDAFSQTRDIFNDLGLAHVGHHRLNVVRRLAPQNNH